MLTAWIYSHTEQWLDWTVLTVCFCGQHYDKPSLVRYPQNKPEKPGRLYRSTRSETIWSDADEDAFATLLTFTLRSCSRYGPGGVKATCYDCLGAIMTGHTFA